MTDTKRKEKAVATAAQYGQGNIAGLDDAMTRRLIASTVLTESNGGDLAITNKQGYVGRYQAGAGWMADAGLIDRSKLERASAGYRSEWAWAESGGMTRFLADSSNWNNDLSLERYKQSADLQDQAFKRNCDATYGRAIKEGVLKEGDDPERIAGFLKARHIAGYGGAKGVIQGRSLRSDSNGTSNYDYYNDIAKNRDGLDQPMSVAPRHSSRQPLASLAPSSTRHVDSHISVGDSGSEVHALQASLRRLGYRDSHGHALSADGDFGERTKEALQAFQRDHGLEPDGIAGRRAQAALRAAGEQLLTHPQHPHHGLFRNAMEKVHGAEFERRIAPGPHSERLAAALTVEALREGLTRIDRVELNDRGTLARAVQVHPLRDEAGLNRSTDGIETQQGSAQSILESSQQAPQVANMRLQQAVPQRVLAHDALAM